MNEIEIERGQLGKLKNKKPGARERERTCKRSPLIFQQKQNYRHIDYESFFKCFGRHQFVLHVL